MIYLLYGADTFRSRRLLSNIIDEFKKKAGVNIPALFWFDAEEDGVETILRLKNTQSLFASKQLVVVERLFSSKKNIFAVVEPFLAGWGETKDSIFVLWDGDCGESAALSTVKKYADKIQEFRPLGGVKLEHWVEGEVAGRGVKISSTAKRALVQDCQGDLWKLTNALDKYEAGGIINDKKVAADQKIWNFTDAFLENKRRALASAVRFLSKGDDTLYLLSALARTIRTVLVFNDAREKNVSAAEIGKKMKLHPYIVKKQTQAAGSLSRDALLRTYRLLGVADENTKTGKLPASIAFLNLFVK